MKNPTWKPMCRCRGLTLVELMIAIVLSIVLLGGTIGIFLSTKQVYRTQEDMARIQENLRYSITQFIKDGSLAGFGGCAPSAYKGNSKVTNTVSSTDFTRLIEGEENTGYNGTDKLTLRYALADTAIPVFAAMASQTADVVVDPKHPNYVDSNGKYLLKKGDVIAVSDCDAIAVFEITNDPGTSGALKHDKGIQHVFGSTRWASATVYKVDEVTLELDKDTQNGQTLRSLYATRLDGARQAILTGVEDFQVEYGIDNAPKDGTADRYVTRAQVSADQLHEITSLRIRIVVNPGLPVPGSDGVHEFKKTAEFTIKLRNRNGDA